MDHEKCKIHQNLPTFPPDTSSQQFYFFLNPILSTYKSTYPYPNYPSRPFNFLFFAKILNSLHSISPEQCKNFQVFLIEVLFVFTGFLQAFWKSGPGSTRDMSIKDEENIYQVPIILANLVYL